MEILIPVEKVEEFQTEITSKNIISYQNSGSKLTEDDIEIVQLPMDYGNDVNNPFESIYFYKKNEHNSKITNFLIKFN